VGVWEGCDLGSWEMHRSAFSGVLPFALSRKTIPLLLLFYASIILSHSPFLLVFQFKSSQKHHLLSS
jgi:hypothetical protein